MPMPMRILMAAGLAAALCVPAFAHEYKLGDLAVDHPWARATPAAAPVGGGYLTVKNTGATPDRLVSATFEGSAKVEIHEMANKDGVMSMRAVPNGIVVPPGGTVELAPGGLHLMFTGLKGPLKQGEAPKGVLVFEKAGRLEVEFKIEPVGFTPKGKPAAHDAHKH